MKQKNPFDVGTENFWVTLELDDGTIREFNSAQYNEKKIREGLTAAGKKILKENRKPIGRFI